MRWVWSTHPGDAVKLTTEGLRDRFVVSDLFEPGSINLAYMTDDRMVIGGAMPAGGTLVLDSPPELRSDYFLERRELGVVILSGSGQVLTEEESFAVGPHDVVYLPLGTRSVAFSGDAVFYLVSAPAHAQLPAKKLSPEEADPIRLGTLAESNLRTIRKYIHTDGIASNQLVLGITSLDEGSVWNTMPPHLHARRTEIYLYDGLGEGQIVHLMGEPGETRHLLIGDRTAVIAPPWSIHSGAGTTSYSFVWAMAGENVDYSDVESIAAETLA